MRTLFLAWQDPTSRRWFPIGRLSSDGLHFHYVYTEGALEAHQKCSLQPLASFPDFHASYESDLLFPLFANRILSPSRPDYGQFAQWLNIPQHADDPMAILARSGGRRTTDTLEVFPCPERDEQGRYHIHFFAHGLRHLPPASIERITRLQPAEQLLIAHDFQNPHDPNALLMRTNDRLTNDRFIVGYCPRYLLQDAFAALQSGDAHVAVERVNPPPAPLQFRLLCNLTAQWPEGFQPFSARAYQPVQTQVAIS